MSKKQHKVKPIPRQIRWDKLDNTAHLFPSIAGESMTNVYRISVELNEEVQREALQQALDIVLPKFDGFNVRLRTGVFWYYFEENGKKAPKVTEEAMFPSLYPSEPQPELSVPRDLLRLPDQSGSVSRTDGRHGRHQFLKRTDLSVSAPGA